MVVVSAPVGGFANHTMWLLWIHNRFSNIIRPAKLNEQRKNLYNIIKGSDWPDLENLADITNSEIISELQDLGYLEIVVENKVKFILDKVYHRERTWHNWLQTEHHFRERLTGLQMTHNANSNCSLLCKIDPDISYKNYIKINSSMNNQGIEIFYKVIDEFNAIADTFNDRSLVVNNSILFQETLDINYYNKLVQYFDLDYQYEKAQQIHNAWYTAQIRSQQEFLKEVRRLYD